MEDSAGGSSRLGLFRPLLRRFRGSPAVWGGVLRDIGILWLVFGTLDALLRGAQLPIPPWSWYSSTVVVGAALIALGVMAGEGE